MGWGDSSYGLSSWGSADFIVTDHSPADDSTGAPRLTTISFTLASGSANVDISSINLTADGIQLIVGGLFTSNATGTINNTDPMVVHIAATVTHAFPALEVVLVVVDALTVTNQAPVSGTTWEFTVSNTITIFPNYIVNRFEKVLRVSHSGLDAPENPMAIPE